jgi:tape measure domain-containing protein
MAQVERIVYSVDLEVNDAAFAKAKAGLDDVAKAAGNVGGQSFDKVTKSVAQLTAEISKLKTLRNATPDPNAVAKYDAEIRKLEKDLSSLNTTARQTSTGVANMGKSFASSALAFGAAAFAAQQVSDVLLTIGKNAINSAIAFEQTRIALEVIAGSAEKAAMLLRQIDALAIVSPFDTAELEKSARSILSVGVEVDKVVPTLKLLTDVAASGGKLTAEQLERTSRAYTQIIGRGKVASQELIQFSEAGINVKDLLAKELNLTLAELEKNLELGRIPAQALTNAFITATSEGGKFDGLAEKLSQSVGGRLNTAIDTFNIQLRDLGTKVLPVISTALETVGVIFGRIGRFFELIGGTVDQLKRSFEQLGVVGDILKVTMSVLLIPLGLVAAQIYAVITAVKEAPRFFYALADTVVTTFSEIVLAGRALVKSLEGVFTLDFGKAKEGFNDFLFLIERGFGNIGDTFEGALVRFDATKPKEEIDKLTKSNADLLKSTAAGTKGQKDYAAAIRDKTAAVEADTKAIEDAIRKQSQANAALRAAQKEIESREVGTGAAVDRINLELARESAAERLRIENENAVKEAALRRQTAVDKLNQDRENAVKEINEAKITAEQKNAALVTLQAQYAVELAKINAKSNADVFNANQGAKQKEINATAEALKADAQTIFELQRQIDSDILKARLAALNRDVTDSEAIQTAIRLQSDVALAEIDKENERIQEEIRKINPFELDTEKGRLSLSIFQKQLEANALKRKEIELKADDDIYRERIANLKRVNEQTLNVLKNEQEARRVALRGDVSVRSGLRSGGGLREALGLPNKKVAFEERDDIKLLNQEIENTKKLYEEAVLSFGLFSEEADKALDDLNKKRTEKADKQAEENVDNLKNIFSAGVEFAKNAIDLLNTYYDVQIERANEAISRQEAYIDTIKQSLNAGSDAYEQFTVAQLAAEEKRLGELQKQREKDVRAQQVLAQIQIATQLAVAVANAAAAGFGVASAITIAAAIAAAAAGFIKSKAIAQSAVPQFGEGGIIEGKSHKQGGVLINAEGGEYVANKKATGKYLPLLEAINKDRPNDIARIANQTMQAKRDTEVLRGDKVVIDNKELSAKLDSLTKAVKNQTLTSRTDGRDLLNVVAQNDKRRKRAEGMAK